MSGEFLMTFNGGLLLGLAVVLPVWGGIALANCFRRRHRAKERARKIAGLREHMRAAVKAMDAAWDATRP